MQGKAGTAMTMMHTRVDETKLKTFRQICDEKAINPSKLIRLWIDRFIIDNAKSPSEVSSDAEVPKRVIIA